MAVKSKWDNEFLITGDFNINLNEKQKPEVQRYCDIMNMFNLHQIVTKPTRTTSHSSTLIDHIITSDKNIITSTVVLPCDLISDHDAPYAMINLKTPRY